MVALESDRTNLLRDISAPGHGARIASTDRRQRVGDVQSIGGSNRYRVTWAELAFAGSMSGLVGLDCALQLRRFAHQNHFRPDERMSTRPRLLHNEVCASADN